MGVGVVGFVVGIEGVESDGEGFVDGVGSGVGTASDRIIRKSQR